MSTAGRPDTSSTDRLLDALVEDARPVRRILPLGRVALCVAVAFVLWWGVGVRWLTAGGAGEGWLAALGDGFFLALVVGLVGATGHALAGREPGRDVAALVSWGLLGLGAAAAGITFVARSRAVADPFELGAQIRCAEHAVVFGAVPAIALMGLAFGGWRGRPIASAVAAAVGGVSLGALMVQMTCPADGAWHVMLGHVVEPLAAAALLAAGLGWAWRWWSTR